VNGAGKSSIAGAMVRARGGDYFNPDEAARLIRAAKPRLGQREANSLAWHKGRDLLRRALDERLDYTFETTLGAHTLPGMLAAAAEAGAKVHVWFVGLDCAERHIARVRSRVMGGGHDIPESDIRRRFDSSRQNLVWLMPKLASLRVYDNSFEADPARGKEPRPRLVLHLEDGRIVAPSSLQATPAWAKPIVAQAMAVARR
jgi:predicted ABC-type ATPase